MSVLVLTSTSGDLEKLLGPSLTRFWRAVQDTFEAAKV
jgi:hypothetical protein